MTPAIAERCGREKEEKKESGGDRIEHKEEVGERKRDRPSRGPPSPYL